MGQRGPSDGEVLRATGRQRRQPDEDVSCVTNRRVRQHPFDVRLDGGREVADCHRDDRDNSESEYPVHVDSHGRLKRERPQEDAEPDRESGGFRGRREERGHRGGRPLVCFWRPEVEGDGRSLERNPAEDEQNPDTGDSVQTF